MARKIRAWEYLFGGLSFAIVGTGVILASVVANSTSATSGFSMLYIDVPWGALLFGIGAYWLWKFDRVHRQELSVLSNRLPAK